MRIYYTIIFTTLFFNSVLHAQGNKTPDSFKGNHKTLFTEAESNFLYEEYNEALYLYQSLLTRYDLNKKYQYRIGLCQLNIPGNVDKAIKTLENIKINAINECKPERFDESCVPMDVYFYLGDAYLMNKELDNAIEAYNYYIKNADPKIYIKETAEHQLKSCQNAKKLIEKPIDVEFVNQGSNINANNINSHPVVSADESIMIYSSKLRFYDAVYFTQKKNDVWQKPINIIPQLGIDGNCYPTSISSDNKTVYFTVNQNFNGDIYASTYENNKWTPIKKLNSNINTKYWESHACISQDGNTLYFSSNRQGGFGGLDIYKSTKDAKGEWGVPENLGSSINTEWDENTPFVLDNGNKIYFSSTGHLNIGGYDIFMSKLSNNTYSAPENLGYPINTTMDDLFFMPLNNGGKGYISTVTPENQNKIDIFKVILNRSALSSNE